MKTTWEDERIEESGRYLIWILEHMVGDFPCAGWQPIASFISRETAQATLTHVQAASDPREWRLRPQTGR